MAARAWARAGGGAWAKKSAQLLVSKQLGGRLATSYFRTSLRRTIIGAAAFHFRVRNGNGWGHCARITRRAEGIYHLGFGHLAFGSAHGEVGAGGAKGESGRFFLRSFWRPLDEDRGLVGQSGKERAPVFRARFSDIYIQVSFGNSLRSFLSVSRGRASAGCTHRALVARSFRA